MSRGKDNDAYAPEYTDSAALQHDYPADPDIPMIQEADPNKLADPDAQQQEYGVFVVQRSMLIATVPNQNETKQSFAGLIGLSVLALCCNLPLGIVAFSLAVAARSKAETNPSEAKSLGKASYAMSIVGIKLTILLILVLRWTANTEPAYRPSNDYAFAVKFTPETGDSIT